MNAVSGAFFGKKTGTAPTRCYFDQEVAGTTTGVGDGASTGVEAKTTGDAAAATRSTVIAHEFEVTMSASKVNVPV